MSKVPHKGVSALEEVVALTPAEMVEFHQHTIAFTDQAIGEMNAWAESMARSHLGEIEGKVSVRLAAMGYRPAKVKR